MRIVIVTPNKLGKQTGNNITAIRWREILTSVGHEVSIIHKYEDQKVEFMIALNAYRSRESIWKFKQIHPKKPLVVALTGTDLYRFLISHKEETLSSMEVADRLVTLSELAPRVLPEYLRPKTYLIFESANKLPNGKHPKENTFDVCVVGHLRLEKDPMLTALAVRDLPDTSKIRVRHYGNAHTEEWAQIARIEMEKNKRYHWYGEVPHREVQQALSECKLFVMSSNMEGGPNSLSEAVMAELPTLATYIDGCVGVLGPDYQGYYPVGDFKRLRELLIQVETDPNFLHELEQYVLKIAPRFSHHEEKNRWITLLNELEQTIQQYLP